jgi:hypothetical protein
MVVFIIRRKQVRRLLAFFVTLLGVSYTNLAIARTFTMPYNEAHHLELYVERP